MLENASAEELRQSLAAAEDRLTTVDTLVFYYAGLSVRASDLGVTDQKELILPMQDFSIDRGADNLSLQDVVASMTQMEGVSRLVLFDACHGTTGIESGSIVLRPQDTGAFMILSSTQDDQYGMESTSYGGGIFTQTLLKQLTERRGSSEEVSVLRLASDVIARLADASEGRQRPKVVAFSADDISL